MIAPMLCEPAKAFDSDDYMIEVKWDGERALAHFDNGAITLQNRKGKDMTFRYPELQRAVVGMRCSSAILDGEIVVMQDGKSKFNLLAQRSHLQNPFDIELRAKQIRVTFMAFDILECNGESVMGHQLEARKELLYAMTAPVPGIFMWSLPLDKEGRGTVWYEEARRQGIEGIIAKHRESPYLVGKRSPYWKKSKVERTMDLWFTRYTINNAGIKLETSNPQEVDGTMIDAGITCQCTGRQAVAVKEALDRDGRALIEVKYMEITEANRLRMPTFKALKEGTS